MKKNNSNRVFLVAAGIFILAMLLITAGSTLAATTLPVLWKVGGLSAGTDSAGQAARIAVDSSGNVAVVSGPGYSKFLVVRSYTASGAFRWEAMISPAISTFVGDWIAAAPNGDFVVVGHNITSSGNPITVTIARYTTNGTLLFRKDIAGTFPSVGRLLVDDAGDAYLAFNTVGDGQDIRLHKYDPSGNLLWSQVIGTGFMANDIATSLAFSPDGADVALSGNITGGATWITAIFNTTTGARRWLVTAPEGIAARDLVVDASRVYVTGQGNVGINGFLTVVAYDRATGAKLWRVDKKPADGTGAAGLRIAKAPDGSLVATGQASRGFLDWYTVAFETTGAVRWEAVRDGGLNTDEIPRAVLVLPDGTTVVTGRGGPNLPGGYIPGVTAGYSPNGTLLWEAFSLLETVWAIALPNGDVCATGGYDALITCWRPSGGGGGTPTPSATLVVPTPTATPAPGGSTGFLSPFANAAQTTQAGDNNGYQTSPANAYANDSLFAIDTNSGTNTNTSYANKGKDKHSFSNFNFNIPPSAAIEGIQVRVDARADATGGSPKIYAQLSRDGGLTWTTGKSTLTLSATEATYTLGDPADAWGVTWNAVNFSNANFRLRIIDVASNTSRDFYLDYVAVNVTYQP